MEVFYSFRAISTAEVVALLTLVLLLSSVLRYWKEFNFQKEIKGAGKREGAWSQAELCWKVEAQENVAQLSLKSKKKEKSIRKLNERFVENKNASFRKWRQYPLKKMENM